jgi:hypothetical protein
MKKVFEALERLKTAPSFMGGTVDYRLSSNSQATLLEDYELVKQALLELKSIKETDLTEALKQVTYLSAILPDWQRVNNGVDSLSIIKQALTTKSKKEQAFDFLTKNFKVMVGVDKGKDLDFACLMFSAKDMKKVFWLAGAYKQQDLKTYNQLLELKELLKKE